LRLDFVRRRLTARGRRSAATGLALALWFGLVAGGVDRAGPSYDLAEFLNNAVRVLHGERPYRDFWLLLPPGEVWTPAWLYRLGAGVDRVMASMALVSALCGLAAFALARALVASDLEAAVAASLVFFNGVPFHHQGFRYIHAYLLCVLLAVLLLLRFFRLGRRGSLFACGLLLGLGMAFRLDYAGAAAVACALALALHARRRGRAAAALLGELALLGAGALVVPGLVCWVMRDVWLEMFRSVAVESVLHGTVRSAGYFEELAAECRSLAGHVASLRGDAPGRELAGASASVEEILSRALPFALGLAWLEWRRRARRQPGPWRAEDAAVFALFAWGCLVFFRGYTRGTLSKLSHATTPWFLVLVFLWSCARGNRGAPARAAAALALASILAFGQHWIAVTLREVGSRLDPGEAIDAPYGRLFIRDERRALAAKRLVEIVTTHTSEDDFIFVTPTDAPPLFALTRRRNPTRYDSLIDLVYRPSEAAQREICAQLVEKRTALVVHSPDWGFGSDPGLRFARAAPILEACIRENFTAFAEVGRSEVLRPAR
jgi:hypothetical protein